MMDLQISLSLSGVMLGPPSQLSALANKRAVLVLPVPRVVHKQISVSDTVTSYSIA